MSDRRSNALPPINIIADQMKERLNRKQSEELLQNNVVVFNYNVEYYRKKAGLTQAELAWYIGSNQPQVALYETDSNKNIPLINILKIARVLDITIADLFTPIKGINYHPKYREKRTDVISSS